MESQVDLIGGEGEQEKLPSGAHNLPGKSRSQGHLGKKPHKMFKRSSKQAPGYSSGPRGGHVDTVSAISDVVWMFVSLSLSDIPNCR